MSEKLFSGFFVGVLVFLGGYMVTKRPLFAVVGFILLIFACIFRFISGKKNRDLRFFKKRDAKKAAMQQQYEHTDEPADNKTDEPADETTEEEIDETTKS